MKQANCIPISSADAYRLYLEGCSIAISDNGFTTTERVQKDTEPAPADFFKRRVIYFLLISQAEAKTLRNFHLKAMAYMVGGFMGMMMAINLTFYAYMTGNVTWKYLLAPLAVSYGAVYCFVTLHELANSAHNEYLNILKKYKLSK